MAGVEPLNAEREIQVGSERLEVEVRTVAAGETWSFSASGQWSNGFIRCGPEGYRNFLAEVFQVAPRAPGRPWFSLMGEIRGQPGSAFPIGTGCTHKFKSSGTLVVFANDTPNGYSNNKGSITLRLRQGGVAPAPVADGPGVIGEWHRFRDVFSRTKGIPFIATLTIGVSLVLVFMQQGKDLIRGVGEDYFWQLPSGLQQIAFALGLLFLALQAWSWSRIIVTSNYGADRSRWRPRWLLVWSPRILGALTFVAAAVSLWRNPASNTDFVLALVAVCAAFFFFVIARQGLEERAAARAARRGRARQFAHIQRYWVIFSLIMAAVLMTVATVIPEKLGVWLGAPAIVTIALGLVIPVAAIGIQIGSSLRIPVVGSMLLFAAIMGIWVDNHAVGRRAFGGAATGPIARLSLSDAYALWKTAQTPDEDGKRTMVLVAAQGGASRAGYWTALALSSLRDAAKKKNADFDAHLFAISSVSGGSVGAVGYAAMLQSAPDASNFTAWLLAFAGKDALGPTMTGMMFPDLLQRFLPWPFLPDRAEALERAWEDAWASSGAPKAVAGVMREPFLNLAPKAGEPWRPILIVQGASENSGRRVLTSGVSFVPKEIDAEDFLGIVGHDVAASTAILNGARFPWVSPGGTFWVDQGPPVGGVSDHILDGGYFDSAGAETLRELVRAIRAESEDPDKLNIIFVLIGYRDPNTSAPTPAVATNDVFAPLFGVFASLPAHERHLAREMKLFDQKTLGDADPYKSRLSESGVDYEAIVLCEGAVERGARLEKYDPPMDWTLSGEAKRYIENSLIATTPACNAKANAETVNAIAERLKR